MKYLSKHPELRNVGLFTLLYMAVAIVFAVQHQNWEFIFYIGVVVLQLFIILTIHEKVHFSPGLLWLLSIWGLLHMAGGLLPVPEGWPINGDKRVFYSLWFIPGYFKYDHAVHAYGFGVCTWVCWQALTAKVTSIRPTLGILTLCALAGMGLGAFNEVIEFVAVLMIPNTNVGGYENTGWDLVANVVGCTIAAVSISYSKKKSA